MKLKLVKIGATWCGQCKQQDKFFEKTPLVEGVILERVDADEQEDEVLEQQNIRSIPVCILYKVNDDNSTVELHRFNGLTPVVTINDYIQSVLNNAGDK